MASIKEECGVCGVVFKKNREDVSYVLYYLLSQLQHRGQTSAGIGVFNSKNKNKLKSFKKLGLVSNLFNTENPVLFKKIIEKHNGEKGIGHVRYATSNVSDDEEIIEEEAQPFLRRHGRSWKKFAIAFNGHLTNYDLLKKDIEEGGYNLDTDVDTEILMHLIALELKGSEKIGKPDLLNVFRKVLDKLDGSFSFVFLNAEGDLICARDKLGFHPLVFGENSEMFAIASESNALSKVGIENFRSILPGEILLIDKNLKVKSDKIEIKKTSHCHFEYVYFSDACSVSDDLSVDDVRMSLGKALAREENLKERFSEGDWIVIPVPSTATPCAMAYSEELGIPISLALIKSEVGRGFINSEEKRKTIMDSKYNVISNRTKDKKIILIDDSIVRGETSKRIVKLLREKGKAKEVHFRVSESMLRFPCCYGVDFHSLNELIVGNFKGTKEEAEEFVKNEIGCDSMGFLSFNGLKESLGGDENKFCFACLTGEYPTPAGGCFLGKCLGKE